MAAAEPLSRSQLAALPSALNSTPLWVSRPSCSKQRSPGADEDACRAKAVGRLNHFGIEERRVHVEERGGEQNALAGLVLCAHLGLAREEGRRETGCRCRSRRGPADRETTSRRNSSRGSGSATGLKVTANCGSQTALSVNVGAHASGTVKSAQLRKQSSCGRAANRNGRRR